MSKRDLHSGPARIMKASEGIEPSISCLLDRRCNHLAMKPRPTKGIHRENAASLDRVGATCRSQRT